MRKPEQRLWDRMRKALGPYFYLERIENLVGAGRPDLDLMYRGVTLPIELKVGKKPVRARTPVLGNDGLNVNQRNWWMTWRQRGGTGFILVAVDKAMFAVPCELSDDVNFMTLDGLSAFSVSWKEFRLLVRINVDKICSQNR